MENGLPDLRVPGVDDEAGLRRISTVHLVRTPCTRAWWGKAAIIIRRWPGCRTGGETPAEFTVELILRLAGYHLVIIIISQRARPQAILPPFGQEPGRRRPHIAERGGSSITRGGGLMSGVHPCRIPETHGLHQGPMVRRERCACHRTHRSLPVVVCLSVRGMAGPMPRSAA